MRPIRPSSSIWKPAVCSAVSELTRAKKGSFPDVEGVLFSIWAVWTAKTAAALPLDAAAAVELYIYYFKINPRSEDNAEAFDAALTNVKDNTFIGSAYEVVDTVPNDIKNALTTDSSPVLTFKTAGVSNSYYSIPAKSYSVDFSWYAPFKGVGDTVVSCFMYLGFLVALWKRLPEIIHGAGVTFVGGVEFHENQLNDMINDTMANDYYEHLKTNGGYDDIDDF